MKTCNTCKKKKHIDEFQTRQAMKDNRKGWCKSCEADYQQKKHLERKQYKEVRHF